MNATASPDEIADILGAACQHGPLNRRIYLMNLGSADPDALIPVLHELVQTHRYTKIFAKVPASKTDAFYRARYRKEAAVPGFYRGREEAVFLGRYFDHNRETPKNDDELNAVIDTALAKQRNRPTLQPLPEEIEIRVCVPDDVVAMSRLYRDVFPSYPFPIQDPDYLLQTMRSHVVYFAAMNGDDILALSSAEMDEDNRNVEMTDFATRPDCRGRRLAKHLLARMEQEMRRRNIACAYTISRAASYPINITFSTMGYRYGGRLVNNTNIGGQIESMSVWYKSLEQS